MAIKLGWFQRSPPNRQVEEVASNKPAEVAPTESLQPQPGDSFGPAEGAGGAPIPVAEFEKRLAGWVVEDCGTQPGFLDPSDLIRAPDSEGSPAAQAGTDFLLLSASPKQDGVPFLDAVQAFQQAATVQEPVAPETPLHSEPPKPQSFEETVAALAGDGINVSEQAVLANALLQLDVPGQSRGLEYLLGCGYPNTFVVCSQAADAAATISLGGFCDGIDKAADGSPIEADEVTALAQAFQRLAPEDQGRGLEELLRRDYCNTYLACAAVADPGASVGLAAFCEAIPKVAQNTIEDHEQRALADALQRMAPADHGAALEELLKRAYCHTYLACDSLADASATVSLGAFREGLVQAAKDSEGVVAHEQQALAHALCRMAPEDQGPALDEVLKRAYCSTYAACSQVADSAARISLDAFCQGVAKAAEQSIEANEKALLADAIQRMAPEEQGQGLEELLRLGYSNTYLACAQVCDSSTRISLDGFRDGIEGALKDEGSVDELERSTLVDAIQRMDESEQGAALVELLGRGYKNAYKACSSAIDPTVTISLAGFFRGVEGMYGDESIDAEEQAALADAFRRLDPSERPGALERLSQRGFKNTYRACADSV